MQNLQSQLIKPLAEEIENSGGMADIREIRLRLGQQVRVRQGEGERTLSLEWTQKRQQEQLMRFVENSLYAFEEQVRQGYITLAGGHRVGICGTAWYDGGRLAGFRDISSMNVRVAREVLGVSQDFLPYIVAKGRIRRVLIAAAPGVGKTTLLRDLARVLAEGGVGIKPQNVGIADERQEIAAQYMGKSMLDLGSRCDVISGCAKADSLVMLLRAMSPDVLLTDEIGTAEDAAALQNALNAGVAVIATAHAANYDELLARQDIGSLLLGGYFERVIFPMRYKNRLTVGAVYDENGERLW